MITFLSEPAGYSTKESVYLRVRIAEGRIFSDAEVRQLPEVGPDHPHKKEWLIRDASLRKLQNSLIKRIPHDILDIGCGNGWMTHRLSEVTNSRVTGIDLNQYELEQATRTFGEKENLCFVYGDVMNNIFPPASFNTIILAASIQYFSNLEKLVSELLKFLKPAGEIHIIDSPVYTESETEQAKKRSLEYYRRLGFPEMSDYYFHHHWKELQLVDYLVLNRTLKDIIALKIFRDKALLFPWIVIRNRS